MEIWEEKLLAPFEPGLQKRYSLSAIPAAREPAPGASGFLRDCHAIYDIKILDPLDRILDLSFYLNDIEITSVKRGGVWSAEDWFTCERVLPVCLLPYMADYLSVTFKGGDFEEDDAEVQITWKKVTYDAADEDRMISLATRRELAVSYSAFRLIFAGGHAAYVGGPIAPFAFPEKYKITNGGVHEIKGAGPS